MVGLKRNEQDFWYSLYLRNEPTFDEWGNENGNKKIYSNPVKLKANISAARGQTENELFGVNAQYDKTINPLPRDCPIDEVSVLWVDKAPVLDENGMTTTGHDYVVSLIAKSLNHKAYAISKVNTADGVGVYGELVEPEPPDEDEDDGEEDDQDAPDGA